MINQDFYWIILIMVFTVFVGSYFLDEVKKEKKIYGKLLAAGMCVIYIIGIYCLILFSVVIGIIPCSIVLFREGIKKLALLLKLLKE